MNKSGYIYFASNPSVPGLLKNGATKESPSRRLPGLHTTGVPTPFVLEVFLRVRNSFQVETRVHELLAQTRHAANREFFQISLDDALTLCLPYLKEVLAFGSNQSEVVPDLRLPNDEESVLCLIVKRTKQSARPTRREVQAELKLSAMKEELLIRNLIRRKFVRLVTESRSAEQTGPASYNYREVKVLNLERAGIQYLIDHGLITPEQL